MLVRLLTPLCLTGLLFSALQAQDAGGWDEAPEMRITGFADVFYVYDFNRPPGTKRQPFLYNHNRHNEVNVNLAFIRLGLAHSRYRANLALQTGTYANDNYAAEPSVLKNIFEANVGIALNRRNDLWLDAGVLPSHIGFESAVSIDNWTLTRSLLADNSPYFCTGAKLTYTPHKRLEMAVLLMNGWQRIQRLAGNSLPSFGSQVIYRPFDGLILNWSTFVGTDDPDASRRMRYFHNMFAQYQATERFGLIAGFDIGTQQTMKGASSHDLWFSPVIIARLQLAESWKTAVRVEYYHDPTGIIIPSGADSGFRTTGLSMNFDYSPAGPVACRMEGRWLHGKDDLQGNGGLPKSSNVFLAASIAVRFSEIIGK